MFEVQTATPRKFRSADDTFQEPWTKELFDILPSPPAAILSRERGFSRSASPTRSPAVFDGVDLSTQSPVVIEDVDPLIRFYYGQGPERRFKVLQQWEGVVTEISEDSLLAELLDLTDPAKPREIVEIPRNEIPDADQDLLLPGCVFYWIIGFEISNGGQKGRVSEIRLRRNPKWSHHDIDSIKARGKELYQHFKDGVEDNPTQSR